MIYLPGFLFLPGTPTYCMRSGISTASPGCHAAKSPSCVVTKPVALIQTGFRELVCHPRNRLCVSARVINKMTARSHRIQPPGGHHQTGELHSVVHNFELQSVCTMSLCQHYLHELLLQLCMLLFCKFAFAATIVASDINIDLQVSMRHILQPLFIRYESTSHHSAGQAVHYAPVS